MSGNSLPAQLQRVLEDHVAQSDIQEDDELKSIYTRLSDLNDTVEKIKETILARRAERQQDAT